MRCIPRAIPRSTRPETRPELWWALHLCCGLAAGVVAVAGWTQAGEVSAVADPVVAESSDSAESEDPFAAVDEPAASTGAPRGGRVRVRLDVTGELLAPAGPDAAAVREAVEMAARFDFEETSLAPTAPEAAPVVRRSYRDATASMRVGDATTTATLGADDRQLLVARQGTTPMPYLDDGFLSGEESDLLETPFDSLLIDDLLPREPVSIGQVWEIPADVTAGLLAIDTVESGVIEARIQDVTNARATVTFAGIIDGAVDGVPTHVTVEGSFAVAARTIAATTPSIDSEPVGHQLHGRVAQVSAVIRERRQASHVAPGFDVEARLLVARTSLDPGLEKDSGQHAGPVRSGSRRPVAAGGGWAKRPCNEAGRSGGPRRPVFDDKPAAGAGRIPAHPRRRAAGCRAVAVGPGRTERCRGGVGPPRWAEGRAARVVGHRRPASVSLDSLRAGGPGWQPGQCHVHV